MPPVPRLAAALLLALPLAAQPASPPLAYARAVLLETTAETSANVSLGDLNGDGHLDAVLAKGRHWPLVSRVLLGDGRGGFGAPCLPFAPEPATTITAADFNRDGRPDLLVPHRNGGQSRLYLGAAGGDLTRMASLPFGPADAQLRIAEAADFDGDGALDVVAIDEVRGPALYVGRGDGTFAPPVPVGAPGIKPYALTVGDLDCDGRPDFVVGNVQAPSAVYRNDGGFRFTATPFGDGQGAVYGIAIGDVNEDGRPDIAVARSEAPNTLYLATGAAGACGGGARSRAP